MVRRRAPNPKGWETGMIEVAPGVYGYVQGGGLTGVSNGGLIVGDDSAMAVDALFVPSMTKRYLREIRRTTKRPLSHLLITHHHIDHTGGNQFFAKANKIAHERARAEMIRFGMPVQGLKSFIPAFADEYDELRLVLPDTTYDDRLTLYQGEREIQLLYLGPAHTPGDTLVYLPKEKVLFAGDVAFHYVAPGPFDCHVSGWIAVCDRIAGMDAEVVVPGHGPIGTKDELRDMREYLALVRREARKSFRAGVPEQEAARRIKLGSYYSQWTEGERLSLLVGRIYMELAGKL